MAHSSGSAGPAPGQRTRVRYARAWWWEVAFFCVFAAAAVQGLASRHGHHLRLMTVQGAIVIAVIVIVAGLIVFKGLRAGIEVTSEEVIVRRAWLPSRRVSWDEVAGCTMVSRFFAGGGGTGPDTRAEYVAIHLKDGRRVMTFGLAALYSRRLSPRKEGLLDAKLRQLEELHPHLVPPDAYLSFDEGLRALHRRHEDRAQQGRTPPGDGAGSGAQYS